MSAQKRWSWRSLARWTDQLGVHDEHVICNCETPLRWIKMRSKQTTTNPTNYKQSEPQNQTVRNICATVTVRTS